MDFSTREDIDAPIDGVFAALTEFDRFERAAMRRGAEVVRSDLPDPPGLGSSWRLAFDYQGKRRRITATIDRLEVPTLIRFTGAAKAVTGEIRLELVALSRGRTRVKVSLQVLPQSLVARIYIQSLRLMKSRVNERFAARVSAFAQSIEERARDRLRIQSTSERLAITAKTVASILGTRN
jgi:uncharacterized protein YndB with AHSA1/START domain